MNVLSLFDGISCGQIALERSGIVINKYFASEVDKSAIKVTQNKYPNTIQLGDVTKIKYIDNKLFCEKDGEMCLVFEGKIDLLIGGSPCQGFSFAGKQLNFSDPRSKLFFEYARLLDECKPKYFLLENVKMKKQYQQVITDTLKVEPLLINSSLFSKQNRARLYWTNIPINEIKQTDNDYNGYLYRLGHGYVKDEIKFFKKYPSLAAQDPSTKYRIVTNLDVAKTSSIYDLRRNREIARPATPEECEEFQTLPIGYTDILKKTSRYKVIGNGWTVDVVAHIFKGLYSTP